MRILHGIALAALSAGTAWAGEAVLVAPAPDWVKPASLPSIPVAASDEEAPFRVLLQDSQALLERDRLSIFNEYAIRIQTPQGLGIGNIALPWRPEIGDLTIHKVAIKRGDQTIDILANGQTFTVLRRETNLEQAMLDGILIATLQPEGLQVGDILNVAATISASDPTLKGHAELIGADWNAFPIQRAQLRVTWPADLPLRIRKTPSLPDMTPSTAGKMKTVDLRIDDLEPVAPPKYAPPRYMLTRLAEMTDFADWADMAALLAPLYETASRLPETGPLRDEVERIKAASSDPKTRAEAALMLVQDRVRYVLIGMNTGNLVPATTAETWARRFGDCKAKTVLLLGLLHELGIEAEPVAVNTIMGDGLDQRLPMIRLFNHVLVRAKIDGRTYWLDGTRSGDRRLDTIRTPNFRWGLPLVRTGAALVRMMPEPLEQPAELLTLHMDATGGLTLPAPTTAEQRLEGDSALMLNTTLSNLTATQRDQALRDYWKEEYDFIDIDAVQSRFDADNGIMTLSMSGKARMKWNKDGGYETDGSHLGYKADFSRDDNSADKDAPYLVYHPTYSRTVQTILLPKATKQISVTDGADVDQTTAGIQYRRKATIAGTTVTIDTSTRSLAPEFPASEAKSAEAALRALNDKAVYVRVAGDWPITAAEIDRLMTRTFSTANEFHQRAVILAKAQRLDKALQDFNQALALDPAHERALIGRATLWANKKQFDKAFADLELVKTSSAEVFALRGMVLREMGDLDAAIAEFTKGLNIEAAVEQRTDLLGRRAYAYRAKGDNEPAMADATEAIKLGMRTPEIYLVRANILRAEGKGDEAVAQAEMLVAALPDNAYALVTASQIFRAFNRKADAIAAIDRAVELEQATYIYMNRSSLHDRNDVAARRADLEAALRLEPDNGLALRMLAELELRAGNYDAAIGGFTKSLEQPSDIIESIDALTQRGIAYMRANQPNLANRDLSAAAGKAVTWAHYNQMCWTKVMEGAALESALADCEAALEKAPDNATVLDSYGHVLLRLDRLDDAVATFDKALALDPKKLSSLFGRSIAFKKQGLTDRAKADFDKAVAADPDIVDYFAYYDLRP